MIGLGQHNGYLSFCSHYNSLSSLLSSYPQFYQKIRRNGKKVKTGRAWALTSARCRGASGCVSLGKSVHFSMPQLYHLHNINNIFWSCWEKVSWIMHTVAYNIHSLMSPHSRCFSTCLKQVLLKYLLKIVIVILTEIIYDM